MGPCTSLPRLHTQYIPVLTHLRYGILFDTIGLEAQDPKYPQHFSPVSSSSNESSSFEDEFQFTIIASVFVYFQLTELVGDLSLQIYSLDSLEAFQMDVLVFNFSVL